jgi:hypothetical protein
VEQLYEFIINKAQGLPASSPDGVPVYDQLPEEAPGIGEVRWVSGAMHSPDALHAVLLSVHRLRECLYSHHRNPACHLRVEKMPNTEQIRLNA